MASDFWRLLLPGGTLGRTPQGTGVLTALTQGISPRNFMDKAGRAEYDAAQLIAREPGGAQALPYPDPIAAGGEPNVGATILPQDDVRGMVQAPPETEIRGPVEQNYNPNQLPQIPYGPVQGREMPVVPDPYESDIGEGVIPKAAWRAHPAESDFINQHFPDGAALPLDAEGGVSVEHPAKFSAWDGIFPEWTQAQTEQGVAPTERDLLDVSGRELTPYQPPTERLTPSGPFIDFADRTLDKGLELAGNIADNDILGGVGDVAGGLWDKLKEYPKTQAAFVTDPDTGEKKLNLNSNRLVGEITSYMYDGNTLEEAKQMAYDNHTKWANRRKTIGKNLKRWGTLDKEYRDAVKAALMQQATPEQLSLIEARRGGGKDDTATDTKTDDKASPEAPAGDSEALQGKAGTTKPPPQGQGVATPSAATAPNTGQYGDVRQAPAITGRSFLGDADKGDNKDNWLAISQAAAHFMDSDNKFGQAAKSYTSQIQASRAAQAAQKNAMELQQLKNQGARDVAMLGRKRSSAQDGAYLDLADKAGADYRQDRTAGDADYGMNNAIVALNHTPNVVDRYPAQALYSNNITNHYTQMMAEQMKPMITDGIKGSGWFAGKEKFSDITNRIRTQARESGVPDDRLENYVADEGFKHLLNNLQSDDPNIKGMKKFYEQNPRHYLNMIRNYISFAQGG